MISENLCKGYLQAFIAHKNNIIFWMGVVQMYLFVAAGSIGM
jgi:hypothetical protein